MENNVNFTANLEEGRMLERAVQKKLSELLPSYRVKMTDQGFDSKERDDYSLVDVVVLNALEQPVLGVECKLSETKFKNCKKFNGWDGDFNTPINRTSLRKYKSSSFPFYLVNINKFCHRAFAASLQTILASPHDYGVEKPWGALVYNVDSTNWMNWYEDFTLTDILTDIIRRELC